MGKKFTCACCHEEYELGRSEKAEFIEKNELFPDTPLNDCERVCEDCFILIMEYAYKTGHEKDRRYLKYLEPAE